MPLPHGQCNLELIDASRGGFARVDDTLTGFIHDSEAASGLLLITNDGHWSRHVTQPQTNMPKVYYVETEQEITEAYISKFSEGVYFAFEDLTTLPASLELLGPRSARLSIVEGRYHQVKRMFGFFDNKVVRLHRESIGPLLLDSQLAPGEYRALSEREVMQFQPSPAN